MRKSLLLLFTFFIYSAMLFAQRKEYRLVSRTENADFNYKALNAIDTTTTRATRRNVFMPVKGEHTVFVFMATYKGLSYTNTEKEFHDLLILKTDKKQKILDAYQYTLEWAEMPFSYDLFRASAKGAILENGLLIENLRFRRKGTDSEPKETGVILF